jgi:hypothetical protein
VARYLVLGDPVVALGPAALGAMVEPYLAPLYQPWYDVPVEPAHAYNARRIADGGREGDRGAD